jgi:predicted Zn-dependent peptidase
LSTTLEHTITALPSGVRVASVRLPGVRSVALGFWIGAGSATEEPQQAGISHLLEHMLFRGSARFESEQIDQIFDAMGAEINAGTDKEATSLYTRMLDRNLPRAFEVMSDMVWRPRMAQLDAEREVVLEEIAMYEDDPQDRVFDLLGGAVFGEHPLGRAVIGNAAVIAGATREQLADFHRARYRPERVVISAAGSVDHDELVELARAGEHDSPADPPAPTAPTVQLPPPRFSRRVRFLQKDTEQYHVCLGGRGLDRHDERRFALRVLEGVLGGTSSSRLFVEVRERRGLAYSVFCFSNLFAASGEVGIYLGTRPDNLREAIAVIADELARLRSDPASPEELERSRENLKGRLVLSMESTAARMTHLGGSLLAELPVLSVDELIERIERVQFDDLRELAQELFDPAQLSISGVGPDESAFHAAIEPLAQARGEIGGDSRRGVQEPPRREPAVADRAR